MVNPEFIFFLCQGERLGVGTGKLSYRHEKTFLCAGESFLMPMSIFSHAYENKFS
ncbi:hypothetical protein PARMER_03820 [Parabacteroides merdae ATCC 43184]|nr:hypothetical protein PARMER_03820 [Parabacteroides merdae ATCC 43184]